MSNPAKLGSKSTIEVEDAPGSGVFVKLLGVKAVPGPEISFDETEVTDMDSDAKEFIATLRDFGEIEIPGNWAPNSATDLFLLDWAANNLNRATRLSWPGGVSDTLETFIKNYKYGAEDPNAAMPFTLTLRCSGAAERAP